MVPYSVVIVSWARPLGLVRLVADVKRQRPAPEEIIVWHNGTVPDVPGVLNLRPGFNLGCQVRHSLAASLVLSPLVVWIDDDVSLVADTVCAELVRCLGAGADLVGWRGRLLAPTSAPYSQGVDVQRPGPVHVVKGIIHAAPLKLAAASGAFHFGGPSDDIDLSAFALRSTGRLPVLAELERGAVAVVREAAGYEDRPDHWQERDRVCLEWMARGWAPFGKLEVVR